jgi:hypothetical protein
LVAGAAQADEPTPDRPIPEKPTPANDARTHFIRGAELAREARWAEALASFERAAAIAPHAVTTYNIGACERAIGRYTRARRSFQRALEQHRAATEGELPEALVTQTQTFLAEIDGLLAHASVSVVPPEALLAVDGAPLERLSEAQFAAGTRAAGDGEPVIALMDVALDPGVHVFTLRRKGFATAVVNRSFAPAERAVLRLELDRLPASISVNADQAAAIVAIDGFDIGPAPVEAKRASGSYRVVVRKQGFVPYEASVRVEPGEATKLDAKLVPERTPITKRWWFWTATAAVVAAGVTVTYFAARPKPEPPPYDGGSTGWIVVPQARFGW